METFTQRNCCGGWRVAGGLDARRKLERGLRPAKHFYVLRERIRCAYCSGRMEGTPKHGREHYRCVARTLAPGSPERSVLPALNAWIGGLFDWKNRDQTVAALLASQGMTTDTSAQEAIKKRLADAETRLRRLWEAIEAGADPAAVVDAQAQRAAARAELNATGTAPSPLSDADVYAMIDSLGDIGHALDGASPARLQKIHEELSLETIYDAEAEGRRRRRSPRW